jgi:hypothetical protein
MKLSVYVSLVAILGITTMQSASAQEGRGMRFNFAPNVWRAESARLPKGYGDVAPEPQHNVRAGAVPSKASLGLDPMMLSKPAPAPVIPVNPVVTAQASVPKANASFSPLFGKPMMAQAQPLPTVPAAVAQPATAPAQAPAATAPAAPPRHVVRSAVSGRVRVPSRREVIPVSGTPAVASYGSQHYVPGAFLPSSGSGSVATTAVSGKLIKHH